MGPIMLAILLIVAGAAVWVIGPSVAGVAGAGRAKLLALGLMFGGVALAGVNTVVIVDVGEVGVKQFLGRSGPAPLGDRKSVV